MTTSRQLEEIVTSLEEMSVTLEELKDEIGVGEANVSTRIDSLQAEMKRVAAAVEAWLASHTPDA